MTAATSNGEDRAEQRPRDPEQGAEATEAPRDVAEKPGTSVSEHDHDDALVDEWGRESFPGSDPPAHY